MTEMAKFIPVSYGGKEYPAGIICSITEVAGHMDKKLQSGYQDDIPCIQSIPPCKRKLDSPMLQHFPILKEANKNGIPQLWKNEAWALDFFEFIRALIGDAAPPEVIEIHPPFDDYCRSIDRFLDIYETFEKRVLEGCPSTTICIENRAGTKYSGGKFLVSKFDSIAQLCEAVQCREFELRLA